MNTKENNLSLDILRVQVTNWGLGPVLYNFFSQFINFHKLVFVPGELFQPSQMFVGEARSLTKSGAPEKCFTRGRLWPYRQTLD